MISNITTLGESTLWITRANSAFIISYIFNYIGAHGMVSYIAHIARIWDSGRGFLFGNILK
jgi:hypothetical protein